MTTYTQNEAASSTKGISGCNELDQLHNTQKALLWRKENKSNSSLK
jgi:hypothetical protein